MKALVNFAFCIIVLGGLSNKDLVVANFNPLDAGSPHDQDYALGIVLRGALISSKQYVRGYWRLLTSHGRAMKFTLPLLFVVCPYTSALCAS